MMINLRKIFIFLILIIVSYYLTSCIYCVVKNKYTYLFDGKLTGIDSLINVDGYYHTVNESAKDISNTYFMFYRDGTFASFFWIENDNNNNSKSDTLSIIGGWGQYKIFNDTIKSQTIFIPGGIEGDKYTMAIIDIIERWFIIISKNILLEIYYKNYDTDKEYKWEYLNTKAYFTPLANRPDSNCWLKRNAWAWENGKIIK